MLTFMPLTTDGQTTPLLDRDLFFGNPEISGGQLSPDGRWIAFMKEYGGIMNIWVKAFDAPFDQARPLTDSKRPLYGFFWSYDGKYILYVRDKDGDENINVFAVDPAAVNADGSIPSSRNLTPLEEVTAQIYAVSLNNPDLLMIGLNDRDQAWHDLYRLSISTGERTLLYENKDRITAYDFDWDDNLRLLYRTDEQGTTTLLRMDGPEKLTPIYETLVTEQAYVTGWSADNSRAYLVSNKGDLNLSTLFLVDPVTGIMEEVEKDPLDRVDLGSTLWDPYTRRLINTSYTDDRTRIYWRDKELEADYTYLRSRFPGREISIQSATLDLRRFLVTVWGDRYASESWFFDRTDRRLILQYTPRPKLKEVEAHLSEMKPVRYPSSDGLEIPAYLTLPQGTTGKNLPTVILVHGGPKGPRDNWGYNAEAQFLANRGYAVLQPNFRASGGYGKAFLNAGDLQWGKLMQDDLTWGVRYLVEQGIAHPNKVVIMGGSYGGYATLAGLAFTPDLYAAGVDIVGPSNLFTLLASVPAYWEAGRAFLYGMVGDPRTEEGEARIREASPLFSADRIKKPLLIIQGANDPRVKKAEADQIVIALREKGDKVSYLLADDEGHGFAKPVNKMAMYAEVERFLAEVVGGRYQREMPDDVARRLQELRVDVSTVVFTPKEEVASTQEIPVISTRWKEGDATYEVSMEVQGQKFPMEMTRTVRLSEGKWIVREETNGPMGQVQDEFWYDTALNPLQRVINQMGQNISMQFKPRSVALDLMGQSMEIAMEKAYLPEGPGMDMLVAGMPLSTGYSVVFDMPDLNALNPKQVRLRVTGEEAIEGQQTLVVEIVAIENENDRMTLWIDTTNGWAVRTEQLLPAMMGAKMTMDRK